MGFPIPGDAIEANLDVNRYLVHNPAATFFMKVAGDAVADADVSPGDLLVVDRSLTPQDQSLIVGVMKGQMMILRVAKQGQQFVPVGVDEPTTAATLETWGVVTYIIRQA